MKIDWWTLGIQTVNVAILVWLLKRFFWQPVATMIGQRRATTQKTLAEADEKRKQATAALAEIEKTRAGLTQEGEKVMAAAHCAGEQARSVRLAQAETDAAKLVATAKAAIEKESAVTEKEWAERSGQLAIEIAARLARRLNETSVRAAFLDWLLAEIRSLPEAERRAAAAAGTALEAVSATTLEPAEQERYSALIGKAFGVCPRIVFKVDPALIAGLELHGPHFTVNNSWRADLAQILADIRHGNRD
ncbi:ATPase [Acidisoma sp. L85]|uniref:F0F1 ATP synthase subunit B family protein n=1 Tax=Acidisoma sp. L85 TaxID=1641850 RepID=UPI00131BB3B9|nr:ATPase [Acidisoma sp. L85]